LSGIVDVGDRTSVVRLVTVLPMLKRRDSDA
jgi:hypothetical protein